jgi:hypothetical protein
MLLRPSTGYWEHRGDNGHHDEATTIKVKMPVGATTGKVAVTTAGDLVKNATATR